MVVVEFVGEDEVRVRRIAAATGKSVEKVVRDAVSRIAEACDDGTALSGLLAGYVGAAEGASPGSSVLSDVEIAAMLAS